MEKNLSFIDHVDEFRNRLLITGVFFVLFFAVSLFFYQNILSMCLAPIKHIKDIQFVFISPLEPFLTKMKLCFYAAIVLCIPVMLYHTLAFVMPALKSSEKVYFYATIPPVLVLFVSGMLLTYFFILPFGVYFLISSTGPDLKAMLSISIYIDFFMVFELLIGILFNVPLVIMVLGKIGIIQRETLIKYRKDAVVLIFIIAAILTPPDCITQIAVAVPVIILYELSIFLLRLIR